MASERIVPEPHWWEMDDATLATVLELLEERAERLEQEQRQLKRRG